MPGRPTTWPSRSIPNSCYRPCACGCTARGRAMSTHDQVNILLVDDQPAKLLSYEVILRELGENLIKAGAAPEAPGHIPKESIPVLLIARIMPCPDCFEPAAM